MTPARLRIDNRTARRLCLHVNDLLTPPSGDACHDAIAETVTRLGMVQLDPLAPVTRAHHHIIWSRHTGYKPRQYDTLMQRRRSVFEHFTHDAAILPMSLWPYWARARERRAARYARGDFGKHMPDTSARQAMLDRIAEHGPVCSRDFEGTADKSKHAWMRPPHKLLLEHLWLQGTLAVTYRKRFHKFYDLVDRVIPQALREHEVTEVDQTDTLCRLALDRLGTASAAELQAFWDSCTRAEVDQWRESHPASWIAVSVENVDGSWREAIAPPTIEATLNELPDTSSRVRILSPFDPLCRDRDRLSRLFGFEFRLEIYVPAAKRQYGYYVFPVLQGDRFIGRIELRADKMSARLEVLNYWPETGVRESKAREQRMAAELQRLGGLVGCTVA